MAYNTGRHTSVVVAIVATAAKMNLTLVLSVSVTANSSRSFQDVKITISERVLKSKPVKFLQVLDSSQTGG